MEILASLGTGLVAGILASFVAFKAKAVLFSGRWLLIWFSATLLTLVGSLAVLDLAANWNNPSGISHAYVDPGPLQKGFPLLAVALGALHGGVRASRNARRTPVPSP